MFNLHMAQPTGPETIRPTFTARFLGKGLGFVAGLVLIAAIDALFWNSVLWREMMAWLFPGDRSLLQTLARIGGGLHVR